MSLLPDKIKNISMLPRTVSVSVVSYGESRGYPTAKSMLYHCLQCGNLLLSLPSDSIGCDCGNLFIDVDAGRLVLRDKLLFEILEIPSGLS